jgi:2,4-dienoyl-CoA reductase-like NADH-dependent reductase (Old Yellow Enzyme family)
MVMLFEPLTLRQLTLKNRIGVSPMCQYSAHEGHVTDWHLVHLGAFAKGGAGLVIMEATAVTPEGRITPEDTGLWHDSQIEPLRRLTRFIEEQGSRAGIQLAHAGRKASCARPWDGGAQYTLDHRGWETIGPSPIAFSPSYRAPRAMTTDDMARTTKSFADAARRARAAGFTWLEIHAAHGYLLHSFLSPLSNHREDAYGGSLHGRCKLLLEIVTACRKEWGQDFPLTVRISASDWAPGGLSIVDTIQVAKLLKDAGVDLIDCSSGGNIPNASIPVAPGFQVPFAEKIRKQTGVPTAAVGLITDPALAETILHEQKADLILLGREFLRDPHWPLRAATTLGAATNPPRQYERAFS